MSETPTRFADLPPDAFPFTIDFFTFVGRKHVHSITVDGPGAVHVPGLAEELGEPVMIVTTFADGQSHTVYPTQEQIDRWQEEDLPDA